jgi:threonine/homoserine/homoserine lactone efflux protein
MILTTWLTIVSICMLGAMSPGPSLVIVLRQTLSGGRINGCIAAVTHAIGIGLYAFLSISGLAVLITTSPFVFKAFQWGGAAYLAWLGVKGITAQAGQSKTLPQAPAGISAARDGFLIVFLNPKVAVFFIALFSQVIGSETSWLARMGYASTAMIIDMAWYLLVAWVFSRPGWIERLQENAIWFERLFGVVLLGLGAKLVLETLGIA